MLRQANLPPSNRKSALAHWEKPLEGNLGGFFFAAQKCRRIQSSTTAIRS